MTHISTTARRLVIGVVAVATLCASRSSATPQQDPLSAILSTVPFSNALVGVTKNADAYSLHSVACFYLETENVTCTDCSWGGLCGVLGMGQAVPGHACTAESPAAPMTDRQGGDYASSPAANETACQARCCADSRCEAWVYVTTLASSGPEDACVPGGSCCWLKSTQPAQSPLNYPGGIWSGTATQPAQPPIVVPPTGIRNAVPVGGLGAGTLELRGDGTLHELTFHSASPGGTAKYPTQPDALFAYTVNSAGAGSVGRAIRTAPPPHAAPGVQSIAYAGTYPVSRLDVNDTATLAGRGLTATLFAYHHLVPNDAPTSSHPAAVFSFAVTNTGGAPANVSFMFTLPMGAMRDCQRVDYKATSNTTQPSYAACMHSCRQGCGAWNYLSTTGACSLLPSAGKMIYALGSVCGIRGVWDSSDATFLSLSLHPGDPASEAGPVTGDVALRPVGPDGTSFSFAVSDDPGALFATFAGTGGFLPGTTANGVTGGSFSGLTAAHGAVAVTGPAIAPGTTTTLSIVFSWYFPNRDYYGATVGQFYSTLFESAKDVAGLYDYDHLVTVGRDVSAHTNVFGGTGAASLPSWLSDHFVNDFSHFRNFIYAKDGSMREHEANDCPDLDSVHNDYQRHLPYLWAVPEFETEKSKLYQSCQVASGPDTGMITENPGFYVGEQCGGRRMGDVTTIWALEVLEIYRHTGNVTRLLEAWPAVVQATTWSIAQSAAQGCPAHLVCTYDILGMEVYNATTFNSVLHLALMKAAVSLASDPAVNDTATAAAAEASFTRCQAFLMSSDSPDGLWNSTYSYFRAYTGGEAIMADSLYGQQVALAHGLGWLLPPAMIASHLAAELQYNGNAFGLTVVTGRHTLPPQIAEQERDIASLAAETGDAVAVRKTAKAAEKRAFMRDVRARGDAQDDAIWMGGAPTWSSIALALGPAGPGGGNVSAALEPTRLELENYRSRLHSMWDLTGLSTTDDWGSENENGQPLCTSHYGFMLPVYYLAASLANVSVNIPAGVLSFAPLYPCPFSLPFGLVGREGTLSCAPGGAYTVSLAFGSLRLPAGGLSVNGKAYPQAVDMVGGDGGVSW